MSSERTENMSAGEKSSDLNLHIFSIVSDYLAV